MLQSGITNILRFESNISENLNKLFTSFTAMLVNCKMAFAAGKLPSTVYITLV